MVELEEDVVFFGIDILIFLDFEGYGLGDNILGGKVFGGRGVLFYELFIFRVNEVIIFILRIYLMLEYCIMWLRL